jgi:hypothetical protein
MTHCSYFFVFYTNQTSESVEKKIRWEGWTYM